MNPLLQQLDSGQRAQLDAYLDILLEWNQNMNLTGPCTREEALQRHVVDSLALLPIIEAHAPLSPPSSGPLTLMDVGSGAGFPGLVLAIARPTWRAAGRDPALRDAFQVVTARAVAEMRVLAELCLPFLAPGGLLGAQLIGVEDVACAGQQGRRTALTVRKLGPTPTGYPRAVGRPAKRPLGGYIKKPKAG
ncbi:Ribosomal RNA small subunit methyltransferase G [Auxenochlorella protothecoides]|uniref:Ribosomal RNA small subunit methyltransferase G n=1 Tax=Auxenochlorella protothecoides TaxID=3075 RepID=A0A087SHH2_AUXPR|nr:Ribosomal RNA small subunit methyltransferase G [Auxenochlorella protothecoides]KFM25176.1 Ribosomal RNA small subunit methyltransferase G [Auxenochlorella protothecoides]